MYLYVKNNATWLDAKIYMLLPFLQQHLSSLHCFLQQLWYELHIKSEIPHENREKVNNPQQEGLWYSERLKQCKNIL